MRRLLLILISLAFSTFVLSASVLAQSGKIAGTVTDADTGDPLPGVNVVIQGTTQCAGDDK